jgi:ubiquinone/menaquinone biosynthesis C-methylase UbiE
MAQLGEPQQPALNERVRAFWEEGACGTEEGVTAGQPKFSRAWFDAVEENRYRLEPFIHSFAQFTRHHGKTLLEIGVGAGTDHLQWARAGCRCSGVDLTEEAIATTRVRLAAYGASSELQRVDAERLPFEEGRFDLVYSWGVIHHSERPEAIIAEVHRVLRPGGLFLGMMYNRRSAVSLQLWARYALLRGRPWRRFRDVLWHHLESIGTKAYTRRETERLFAAFARVETASVATANDVWFLPRPLRSLMPPAWGFFRTIRCTK